MGMDMNSGNIRELSSVQDLKKGEVLFKVGEQIDIKGCHFKIKEIYGEPYNQIVFQGISAIEEAFQPETAERHLNRHERRLREKLAG